MPTQVTVCQRNDLTEGSGKVFTVQGRSIAVFQHGGEVVALDADCPHEGGPLAEGTLEGNAVTCPWHNYQFDLTTGACATDPSLPVKRYPVVVEGESIVLVL